MTNTCANASQSPAPDIRKTFTPQTITIDGQTLTTTLAFDAYWYFATIRQNVFHSRVAHRNTCAASAHDDVLRKYRFTNAYRASDRVSQYLIQNIIGKSNTSLSSQDLFFRIMLFKLFNKIETWEALEAEFGDIVVDKFEFKSFDALLSDRQKSNVRNYSAAYIMPSAGSAFGYTKKHTNHLALLRWMMEENFPERLNSMERMSDGYDLLLTAPSLGPFLAYQFVTDINYSALTSFSEAEFVVAGPGAHDGISKCFYGADKVPAGHIIAHMAKNQDYYFSKYNLKFLDLWGRPLQLIDCQNLFCEVSKYTRVAFPEIAGTSGRTRIKQKYHQSSRSFQKPVYPDDWGINSRIDENY